MEDEEIRESLNELEAVWQRVRGDHDLAPAQRRDDTQALAELISRLSASADHYAAAANMTTGRAAAALRTMAAACRNGTKRLQTEHFLRTGDTCIPARRQLPPDSILGQLRRLYQAETETRRCFQAAAAGADGERLWALCSDMAETCVKRLKTIAELVEMILG